MSRDTASSHTNMERAERAIIRKIGKVRFTELKEYLQEGVAVEFLVEEFGLHPADIQCVRNSVQEPIVHFRKTQTR